MTQETKERIEWLQYLNTAFLTITVFGISLMLSKINKIETQLNDQAVKGGSMQTQIEANTGSINSLQTRVYNLESSDFATHDDLNNILRTRK